MDGIVSAARVTSRKMQAIRPLREEPQPARILLVDDHPPNLVALEAILAPLGHPLRMATSGEEALRELLAEDFALVLLDVQMPGMDGLETASMIRSHARMRAMPIIFITAISGTRARIFDGYAHGAVDYIVKPIEPEVLRAKVGIFVEIHEKNEKIKLQGRLLREQQVAALERENESRYKNLADAVPLPIWSASATGDVQTCNRAWAEYCGCSATAPFGFATPRVVHEEDLPRALSDWERSVQFGVPFEMEVRLLEAATQTYRFHLVRGIPQRQTPGAVSSFLVTATDIDDKRRIEEEKTAILEREQRAREAAEEANRAKDEFLATISHELRTPLHAILGWAELLRRGSLDALAQNRALETIERNAHAQARLIGDLLEISRIESGKVQLDLRPADLPQVIQGALETLRPSTAAKGVEVRFETDAFPSAILVDAQRMQQVVWNLTTNAVKFGAKHIDVALRLAGSTITLTVKDDGQGIAQEFLPLVFERFQQADSRTTRYHGGLGLGLSIVRHIVTMHGGSVRVESPGVGHGASFAISLPASRSGTHAIDLTEKASGTLNLGGIDVLVVDDEDDARELMLAILGRSGATLRAAGSVGEAMELIAQRMPDIVISDVGMPGEDGFELARRLRELSAAGAAAPPAVALTAYASSVDRARLLSAGFLAHLTKPLVSAQLFATIGRLLHLGN
jgi:PAS domain S-box-containing protein